MHMTTSRQSQARTGFRSAMMILAATACGFGSTLTAEAQAQKWTAEQLLKGYKPAQKDVEYDTPDAAEMAKCSLALEQGSYVITNAAGQVLRRFTDSNGDTAPDMFRYYHMGLEVYREVDTNGDSKAKKNMRPDQYRWLNWGGTRWGLDDDEDGRIDSWKILSAQEAARIAIEAMASGDLARLNTVLLNEADIRSLRLPAEMAKKLQDAVSDVPKKVQASLANSKVLNKSSIWVRFDPPLPAMILGEDLGAVRDIVVYENAMATVQNGEKYDLISIGELVQIGDVWKLAQIPAPVDTTGKSVVSVGGVMMQPALGESVNANGDAGGGAGEMSAEMQKLLADLQKIDEASPKPDAPVQAFADYNVARANLSEKLVAAAKDDESRQQWIQQFADSLSTATQSGMYPEGLPRLISLQDVVKANEALLGYVHYRRLMAEYAVRLKEDDKAKNKADAEKARELTQKWWFEQLEAFARKWPKSEDAPDAVVQLAISYELMGRLDDAKAWYEQLAKNYSKTEGGVKAQGALRRLNLTGNKLTLAGKSLYQKDLSSAQYDGKVLLVVFWASYAQPFTDDLPAIQAAYTKYNKDGFEILGVNMDGDLTTLSAYLKQHGVTWQSLRDAPKEAGMQPGDFGYGIVSVPTMFLVNKQGIVEGGITTANLDFAVDALLKGKKLESIPAPGAEPPTEGENVTAEKPKNRN
ncbi:MAG: redoxin domain-containing protein [Fuerstia sp.]|nr:redoxin domain-containing protein [Fuerstiella sp.]